MCREVDGFLGGLRSAAFFCSSRITSWRACFTSRPALTWRAEATRSRTQEIPPSTAAPMRSITSIQETPVKSDTDASHTASSSSVAPRKLMALASPLPTSEPSTPPAVFGQPAGEKCSVARPQLDASASTKPMPRSVMVRRSIGSRERRSW